MASDDIPWCRNIINEGDVVFIDDTPELTLMTLSFCDYVVNNGSYFWNKDCIQDGKYESTFGQIAQLLNVSRKFSTYNGGCK